jgi:hypothetical protein
MKFQPDGSLQGPLPIKFISSSSTYNSTAPVHSQILVHLASFLRFNSTGPTHEQSEVEMLKGIENKTDFDQMMLPSALQNVRLSRYNRRPSTREIRIWVFQQSRLQHIKIVVENRANKPCMTSSFHASIHPESSLSVETKDWQADRVMYRFDLLESVLLDIGFK